MSFVQRERTPERAIQTGVRYHPADISSRYASKLLEKLRAIGVSRHPRAVHTADLQPTPTVTADQLAVDEKAIRLHGQDAWLCGAVDPQTDEISHMSLFPTATKRATRWFLADFHRRYQLDGVTFLVDAASYLGPVLAEDGYRF